MRLLIDDYLQVRYVSLYNEKVSKNLKIIVIGDVHISNLVSLKKLELLKKQILNEKADYIVFTGDLIDRVEELDDASSLSKLRDLLGFSSTVSKTIVILGNHDYIHRGNYSSYLEEYSKVIRSIEGVTLLDNEIYSDSNIWFMGYTETAKYYGKEEYDYKVFYDDLVKRESLYKNIDKSLPAIALTHSPEFSNDMENVNLLKDYDLIICGHTHDGCVPFGFGNFKRGIINPKRKFFPKNVRGLRKIGDGYILVTGGVVKVSKVAPKLLHPLNHLCPVQMDVITLSQNKNISIKKKWY